MTIKDIFKDIGKGIVSGISAAERGSTPSSFSMPNLAEKDKAFAERNSIDNYSKELSKIANKLDSNKESSIHGASLSTSISTQLDKFKRSAETIGQKDIIVHDPIRSISAIVSLKQFDNVNPTSKDFVNIVANNFSLVQTRLNVLSNNMIMVVSDIKNLQDSFNKKQQAIVSAQVDFNKSFSSAVDSKFELFSTDIKNLKSALVSFEKLTAEQLSKLASSKGTQVQEKLTAASAAFKSTNQIQPGSNGSGWGTVLGLGAAAAGLGAATGLGIGALATLPWTARPEVTGGGSLEDMQRRWEREGFTVGEQFMYGGPYTSPKAKAAAHEWLARAKAERSENYKSKNLIPPTELPTPKGYSKKHGGAPTWSDPSSFYEKTKDYFDTGIDFSFGSPKKYRHGGGASWDNAKDKLYMGRGSPGLDASKPMAPPTPKVPAAGTSYLSLGFGKEPTVKQATPPAVDRLGFGEGLGKFLNKSPALPEPPVHMPPPPLQRRYGFIDSRMTDEVLAQSHFKNWIEGSTSWSPPGMNEFVTGRMGTPGVGGWGGRPCGGMGGGYPGSPSYPRGGISGTKTMPEIPAVAPKRGILEDIIRPQIKTTEGGSKYLASTRAKYFEELDRNPRLKDEVMRAIRAENGKSGKAEAAVLESMVNRAQMYKYPSLSTALHDGFYGPINDSRSSFTSPLSANDLAKGEEALGMVRGGSNLVQFRTDQGMLSDPGSREYLAMPDKGGHIVVEGENYFFKGTGRDNRGREWAETQQQEEEKYNRAQLPSGAISGLASMNIIQGGKGSISKIAGGAAAVNERIAAIETRRALLKDRADPDKYGTGATRVAQMQQQVAGTRRGAITGTLEDQLNYASTQSDVFVEVTSGGQRMEGAPGATGSHRHDQGQAADLKLYRMVDGKKQYLDMRNPDDEKVMSKFMKDSVKAGATGVGAGLGYMGAETMHIGGGPEAAWGGAGWASEALTAGTQERGSFSLAEWKKTQQASKEKSTPFAAGIRRFGMINQPGQTKDTVTQLQRKAAILQDTPRPKVAAVPASKYQMDNQERLSQRKPVETPKKPIEPTKPASGYAMDQQKRESKRKEEPKKMLADNQGAKGRESRPEREIQSAGNEIRNPRSNSADSQDGGPGDQGSGNYDSICFV